MSTPGPAPIQLDPNRITTLEIPFRFLTWVFGGGVEHNNDPSSMEPTRPFDPVTPVRASGVRGQLRFWWRATTGARLGSMKELKAREARLWGGIWDGNPQHGRVGLTVEHTSTGVPAPVPMYEWTDKPYPRATGLAGSLEYGAFPMRPQTKPSSPGADPRSAIFDHSRERYKLHVAMQALGEAERPEVMLALSAWLAFGGYGGRTTRGFGAVALADDHCVPGITDRAETVLEAVRALGEARLDRVPAIGSARDRLCVVPSNGDPIQRWKAAIDRLRSFRQGKGTGRNEPCQNSKSPAGRSRWPEADAIRKVTGHSHPDHRTPVNDGNAFPRADFGLPITFHFIKRKVGKQQDPSDQTLQYGLGTADRLPSPLILRVTPTGERLALWLQNADAPDKLYLKGADVMVSKKVPPDQREELREEHKKLLEPSPIVAFLKHFKTS